MGVNRSRWAGRLRYLGVLAFAGLVLYVGPGNVWKILRESNPVLLFAAFALNIPTVGLKAWRWRSLMRHGGIECALRPAFLAYFSSLFLGLLTPGRVGEFAKVSQISRRAGVKLHAVFPSVVMDRLFDLCVLVALGLPALVRYSLIDIRGGIFAVVLATSVLTIPLLLSSKALLAILLRILKAVGLAGSWEDAVIEIHRQYANLTLESVSRGLALTLSAYCIFFVQCQLCGRGAGVNIPFFDMALIMAAANLITLIPVTVAGIGVREACLIVMLGKLNIGEAQAVAFSIALMVVFILGGGLIGLACWLLNPAGNSHHEDRTTPVA